MKVGAEVASASLSVSLRCCLTAIVRPDRVAGGAACSVPDFSCWFGSLSSTHARSSSLDVRAVTAVAVVFSLPRYRSCFLQPPQLRDCSSSPLAFSTLDLAWANRLIVAFEHAFELVFLCFRRRLLLLFGFPLPTGCVASWFVSPFPPSVGPSALPSCSVMSVHALISCERKQAAGPGITPPAPSRGAPHRRKTAGAATQLPSKPKRETARHVQRSESCCSVRHAQFRQCPDSAHAHKDPSDSYSL